MTNQQLIDMAKLAYDLNIGRTDGRIYRDFCALLLGAISYEYPAGAAVFRETLRFDTNPFDSDELTPDEQRALEDYENSR